MNWVWSRCVWVAVRAWLPFSNEHNRYAANTILNLAGWDENAWVADAGPGILTPTGIPGAGGSFAQGSRFLQQNRGKGLPDILRPVDRSLGPLSQTMGNRD